LNRITRYKKSDFLQSRFFSSCAAALLALPLPLGAQNWTANWIWQSADGPVNTWLCLRKTVTLSAAPASAPTRIAAENNYWLYINGRLVVPGGGLDLRPDLTNTYYDSIDIAPYLDSGKNVIAALAWYKGGIDGYSQIMAAKGGFLFESHIAGATPAAIVSDNTWKALVHPSFSKTGQSREWDEYKWVQYPVMYDARNSPGDWTGLSFSDSAWAAATRKGVPPAAPWNKLVHRTIPMHTSFAPVSYKNQSSLPASIATNATMRGNVGMNIQGRAYLKITAPAEVSIAIRMNEWYTERYITSSGTQEYTTYQWQNSSGQPWSAHEVEYAFTNVKGTVTIESLKFVQSGYDADCVGAFDCSDPRLDTLWTKCKNTSYVCMRDQFYDCPDRERGQWWGDVSEQLLYNFYLYDPKAWLLAKKGFRELMNTQKPDYSLYTTAPGISYHLPDQNVAAVTSLYDYFMYTGDSALIRELYPKAAAFIKNYAAASRDKSGMLILKDGPWNWIDWGDKLDIKTGGACTVVNGLFVRLMDAAKAMALIAGSTADTAVYNGFQISVRNNFNAYFWNATAKAYVFGRFNSVQSDTIDDRSNAWAVLAGAADSAKGACVLSILNKQQNAGPYQERYIEDAMFVMGKDSAAIARMLSYYKPDIDAWSTTMWERMGSIPSNNHAWAASPCYLLGAYVAGIKPLTAGFSTYRVMPMLGPLNAVSVSVPTKYGIISAIDSLQSDRFTMRLNSPQGTQAVVGIPRRGAWQMITANGAMVWKLGKFGTITGIAGVGADSQYITFNVAPGEWKFVASQLPVSEKNAAQPAGIIAQYVTIAATPKQIRIRIACPGAFTLRVFDAAGRLVSCYKGVGAGNVALPRNAMKKGVYYAHLSFAGRNEVKKIVLVN